MRLISTVVAGLAAGAAGQPGPANVSESGLDAALDWRPALDRAQLGLVGRAAATPLPPAGIAAALGPGQSHVYSLDLDTAHVNLSLSLAECSRAPLDAGPLTLQSGDFSATTRDGGHLAVTNTSLLNGTLTVAAPQASAGAQWAYQLGYDQAATYASDEVGLYWVDSDFANSLFVTLTYDNFSALVDGSPYAGLVNHTDLNATTHRFNLFLHNINGSSNGGGNDPVGAVATLGKSFCAMRDSALLNQNNAVFSTTDRSNNRTDQIFRGQFLFSGLNASTDYVMQLAVPPDAGAVGGLVFAPVPFRTKTSTSCQLIYNMSMCPNTAFSVPGNASVFSANDLTGLYDQYVEMYYNNFTQALAQINCNASRQDMFSVFSTCNDCDRAYRDWLCTVAVPRCEDWSNNASYLVERQPGQSRNNMINDVLRPGRYKEVLPCYWLCNNLATYCPISMGFACPQGRLLNQSYGWNSDDGDVTCSYPGAVYRPDGAWLARPSWGLLVAAVVAVSFL